MNQYIEKNVRKVKQEEGCEGENKKAILTLLEMLQKNFPYPHCTPRAESLANIRYILNVLFLYGLITKKERDELLRYLRPCASRKIEKEKKRVAN